MMHQKDISIVVADDHPLLLKGLVDQLQDHQFNVVETGANGMEALNAIVKHEPDVAILDIEMPLLSGFEVIKKCKDSQLKTKHIILTSHKERAFVIKAKKLNISGYLLKDEPFAAIQQCILSVMRGEPCFSEVFNAIFDNEISPQMQKIKFLSPSERTVIRLVAQGKTSKEIGSILSISHRTVQKHRGNIISKLELPPEMDALSIWARDHKEIILSL